MTKKITVEKLASIPSMMMLKTNKEKICLDFIGIKQKEMNFIF